MPLTAGSRLGPYQIEDLLGAGGMGEVYKARDTRLDRTVAIKVLPSAFSDDPTLRQRLEREARAVSALDHPNICALYDIGSENGLDFIVMQYLPGETLAARLERGPLSADETCAMGAQIADALAAAHRRGIVHRDLKPGNVMIGRDGVRLLDFGLAKHQDAIGISAPDDKTVANPLTGARTIVGTLQYMAPEQLEGRTVDPRTDIFALGAVLYEMLTGRRAFEGDSSASLITAIMSGRRTPISAVAPNVPPPLARIVERCLAPDPDDRWQSAGDLAYALRNLRQNSGETAALTTAPRSRVTFAWWATGAAILIAVAIAAVAFLSSRQLTQPPREIRLSVVPPSGLEFSADAADFDPDFALSPDGTRLAFIGVTADGRRSLWVRDLDSVVPREIAGTPDARQPFWSPDGSFIGYVTRSGLTRISPDGGSPLSIPASVSPSSNANAAWTFHGRIVYEAPAAGGLDARAKALYVVSESGGTATQLVAQTPVRNEQAQRYPVPLPDGRHFLYLSWTADPAERGIYLGALDGGERTLLVKSGFRAEFIAPDLLVYVRDRAIVAQRFDVEHARVVGEPQHIASAVALEAIPGQATFAVSRAGVIAYRSRERDVASELRWVDRSGRTEETFEPATDITVSLAPDGRRVAIARLDNSRLDDERFPSSVFLLDLSRRVQSRFTLGSGTTDENPIWSPDGSRIAYATHRGSGLAEVVVQRPGATGETRVAATGDKNFHPIDWAEDGTLLLHAYATGTGADDLDLYTLAPDASAQPKPLIVAAGSQAQAQFSADGRWIAYTSNESGQSEVYVQSRGGGDARLQVSSEGGGQPRWRGDSRELFYVSLTGTLMAVPIEVEKGELRPARPAALFDEPSLRTNNNVFFYGGAAGYDVTPDGQRFIVNRMTGAPGAGPIHIVLNWSR